jgi:hypothetical protein
MIDRVKVPEVNHSIRNQEISSVGPTPNFFSLPFPDQLSEKNLPHSITLLIFFLFESSGDFHIPRSRNREIELPVRRHFIHLSTYRSIRKKKQRNSR